MTNNRLSFVDVEDFVNLMKKVKLQYKVSCREHFKQYFKRNTLSHVLLSFCSYIEIFVDSNLFKSFTTKCSESLCKAVPDFYF